MYVLHVHVHVSKLLPYFTYMYTLIVYTSTHAAYTLYACKATILAEDLPALSVIILRPPHPLFNIVTCACVQEVLINQLL